MASGIVVCAKSLKEAKQKAQRINNMFGNNNEKLILRKETKKGGK